MRTRWIILMPMNECFIRTKALLGESAIERLQGAKVALFGVGGVGSYAGEALARAGIGTIYLIDGDVVAKSNINRQLVALNSTIGLPKVDVMAARIKDINPHCNVFAINCFFDESTKNSLDFDGLDYVIDAIDTISSKLLIIELAKAAKVPVISCMGAGNKLDCGAFEVADIYKTSVCPLARVMRRELKNRGITDVKVVYSKEEAIKPIYDNDKEQGEHHRRQTPGSISFVPGAAGLMLAGEVIKDIACIGRNDK